MNVRKIREDLGKSRTCVQRRDYPRAIYLFCIAVKDLGGQTAPMDLRGDFRSALVDICADPIYKKEFSQPLSYQPGKEKEILTFLNKFYKKIMGNEEQEDYEATLQRKLNIDRNIADGKNFLSQGKVSEADECFMNALKFYRNEIAVFPMIARALMDSSQYVRALGYLRKGLAERPDDPDMTRLAAECAQKRGASHQA